VPTGLVTLLRSLSPRSSGERATASGAVSAGSNPAGGTAQKIDPKKRTVGFKLFEGMEVPAEFASRLKFARQKSKLAGTIRGSYFDFKNSTDPALRGQSSPARRVPRPRAPGSGLLASRQPPNIPTEALPRRRPQVPVAGRQLSRARTAQDTGSHSFQQLPSPGPRKRPEATRITRVLSVRRA
jgi:hypothetical protein